MKKVIVLNKVNNVDPIDEPLLLSLEDKVQAYWYQKPEEKFSLDEASSLCSSPNIVVTALVGLDCYTLKKWPGLEAIVTTSTAVDYIDLAYCRAHNIQVFNTPSYTGSAVAEHAFSLLMASTKHLRKLDIGLHTNSHAIMPPAMELAGKKIGIIGFGEIGSRVAKYATCFGMEILYYNRSVKSSSIGVQVDLQTLLRKSDVVMMTVPLNDASYHLMGKAELGLMKNSAFLINIGTDEVVQSEALIEALKTQQIAGAGLDVVSEYECYLDVPNLILTQSRGWYTTECIARRNQLWLKTLSHYLSDNFINKIV